MSLTHTISFQGLVGRTYKISGSDSVSGTDKEATVTVTSDGENSATLDLTGESYSSYKVTSISLTYDSYTLSDSVESLAPTLTYTITPYYSNGNAGTAITSGATATWKITDTEGDTTEYFSIDSSGNVTAGTETNYDDDASATVTVTLSYGSYTLSGETYTTATVYREATEATVTSVEVSDISLTYYSDEELTTECSTLSSSITTLYPKVIATVTVYTNANTTGTEYSYDSTDDSCAFSSLGGSVELSYSWSGSSCLKVDPYSGNAEYNSGIITASGTGTCTVTVEATYSESGSNTQSAFLGANPIVGILIVKEENDVSGATAVLGFQDDEMTIITGSTTIYNGDTVTCSSTTEYSCFMEVSDWTSGYDISATFSADGYEGDSDSGTITANNTTTLSAKLEEEETVSSYEDATVTLTYYTKITSSSYAIEHILTPELTSGLGGSLSGSTDASDLASVSPQSSDLTALYEQGCDVTYTVSFTDEYDAGDSSSLIQSGDYIYLTVTGETPSSYKFTTYPYCAAAGWIDTSWSFLVTPGDSITDTVYVYRHPYPIQAASSTYAGTIYSSLSKTINENTSTVTQTFYVWDPDSAINSSSQIYTEVEEGDFIACSTIDSGFFRVTSTPTISYTTSSYYKTVTISFDIETDVTVDTSGTQYAYLQIYIYDSDQYINIHFEET